MPIKHLLVHLDHTSQSRLRLAFALGLARRHRALLVGCYVVDRATFPAAVEYEAQLQDTFLRQAQESDVPAEWLCLHEIGSDQAVLDRFCRIAQCTDLLIVGQADPKIAQGVLRELPERLVLQSGRPVLIHPYAGQFSPTCERVMVAWNGGRESGRALHDSLPFLQQADQVSLLSLIPAGTEEHELEPSLTMLCAYLRHHGIQAHPETQVCLGVSKGDMLLNRCAEEGIGLLVAGGYYRGHLGEVAKHLMRHMTVPVLMSH